MRARQSPTRWPARVWPARPTLRGDSVSTWIEGQRKNPLLRRVGTGKDPRDLAATHDDNAIAHAEDFWKLRRNHHDAEAAPGEILQKRVYLGFRSDVHSL